MLWFRLSPLCECLQLMSLLEKRNLAELNSVDDVGDIPVVIKLKILMVLTRC